MALPVERVELRAGALRLNALQGEGVPMPTGGVGGFEVVPRPGRRPLTIWRAPSELRFPLALLLDGYGKDSSVEVDIETLERMGGLDEGDPTPPVVTIVGAVRHTDKKWVVDSLDWGEGLRRQADGQIVRMAVTVNLLRVTETDRMERIRRPSGRPSYKFENVRKGDTFKKIAQRKLGSARLASRLARLNDARSVDVVLKRKTVRLPSDDALKQWKTELKKGK